MLKNDILDAKFCEKNAKRLVKFEVMTYAERVAKREAEIAGLKEALEILSA